MPTRSTRSLAWLRWVLTLLGLAATGWLDHLLCLAGRPALTWSQEGSLSPGPRPRKPPPATPHRLGRQHQLDRDTRARGRSPSG